MIFCPSCSSSSKLTAEERDTQINPSHSSVLVSCFWCLYTSSFVLHMREHLMLAIQLSNAQTDALMLVICICYEMCISLMRIALI